MRRLAALLIALAPALAAGDAPRGTLKGHLDGPDGRPAPGASLLLLAADGATARGAISGGGGFFVFPDLPGGKYRLLARAGALTTETDAVVKAPFASDIRVRFGGTPTKPVAAVHAATPRSVKLLILSGNETIPNARVYLLANREADSTGAVTTSDGAASLTIPGEARFRVAVEATGFRLYETSELQISRDLEIEIQLVPDSAEFPFEPRSHLPPAQLAAALRANGPASAPSSVPAPDSAPASAPR